MLCFTRVSRHSVLFAVQFGISEDREINRLRWAGFSFSEIGERFGCRRGRVYERYRNYSVFVDCAPKEWTSAEEAYLLSKYFSADRSWVALGAEFGCSANAVKNKANALVRSKRRRARKRWAPEEERKLAGAILSAKQSWVKLGRRFGCSAKVAKYKAASLVRRACGEWRRAPAVLERGACFRCGFLHACE